MARKRKHSSEQAGPRKTADRSIPKGKAGRVRKKAASGASASGVEPDVSDTQTDALQTVPDVTEPNSDFCVGCGSPLIFLDETKLCARCNSEQTLELAATLSGQMNTPDGEEQQFIECPGASIYDEKTGLVSEGADFIEHENGAYEARIIKRPHFPPGHHRRRLVPRDAFGKIRRCQACQDYTVRVKRKEGVDFCIPSAKFPRRTKLKSVDIVSHRRPS